MANKYLDYSGLLYYNNLMKAELAKKVNTEAGKGLSTNDYTTTEKEKLAGIEAGANNTTVEDVLTSTSSVNALSAAQGKVLDGKIQDLIESISELGGGDMMKAVYDTDDDGVVDDAAKLGGQAPSYYAAKTDLPTVTNDLTDALKANYDAAYTHSQAAHAPADAERNVIITVKKNGEALTPDGQRAVDIAVPTATSELTNDSGFLTEHQDISGKADKATTLDGYGITDAYTKTETDSAIATAVGSAGHLKRTIVESLPEVAEADADTIYMVSADADSEDNVYVEWMVINNKWEKIGDTTVDLTPYMLKTDMVAITNGEIDAMFAA